MSDLLETPYPREWEMRAEFDARWHKHPTVKRAFPTWAKRRQMADRRWAEAKAVSLVSVRTSVNEALVFGRLEVDWR